MDIIGLGAMNMDHLYKVERILADGEAVATESVSFPGGSAANTIYGLARLGLSTGFCGAVGDDTEGEILVKDFQKTGADTSRIRIKRGAKTGEVICLSDSLGRRSLQVVPGANNLLTLRDLDIDYMNGADMLHISSFAHDRQFNMLHDLMERLEDSTQISFSPGAIYARKGLKTLAPILSRSYVLFVNRDEVLELTGSDISDGAQACLEAGCSAVVVTLGGGLELETEDGAITATAYVREKDSEYILETETSAVDTPKDTTGAGDAFATGFLYGIIQQRPLSECTLLGDITARFTIAKLGTRQGLPTLKQLRERYRLLHNKSL